MHVQLYQAALRFLGQRIKLNDALRIGNGLVPGLPLLGPGCQALKCSGIGLAQGRLLEAYPFLE